MATYLLKNMSSPKLTCSVWDLVNYYLDEGEKEGVRGDIAFCQSIIETGWFYNYTSSDPNRPAEYKVYYHMNNFCGLGATGSSVPCSFETAQLGVRAQIQHLKAYGSTEPLNGKCVDPRFSYVTRGIVTYWMEFGNGKWAADTQYGQKIMNRYASLMATTPDAALVAKAKKNP